MPSSRLPDRTRTGQSRRPGWRVAAGPAGGLAAAACLAVALAACRAGESRTGSRRPLPEATPTPTAPRTPPPAPVPMEAADPKGDFRAAIASAGGVGALDPLALLPFAEQRSRALLADAALVGIACFPVREDGRADLTLVKSGRCDYTFRSPLATRRRPDLPIGIRTRASCLAHFSVRSPLDRGEATVSESEREDCRRRHLVAPPVCTPAEVWQRARAAGAPAGAVATLGFACRYRSAYDMPDPADEPDETERGLWHLRIDRDDGPSFRFETWDDCGAPPASSDEKRVAAAVAGLRPALRACFASAAGRHDSVAAFELVWRLAIDPAGRTTLQYADTGVDIEGVFQGSLGQVRTRFAECTRPAFARLRLPPALGSVRLLARVGRDGRVQLAPPPYR